MPLQAACGYIRPEPGNYIVLAAIKKVAIKVLDRVSVWFGVDHCRTMPSPDHADQPSKNQSLGTSMTFTLDELAGGVVPNHFLCVAETKPSFFSVVRMSLTLAASAKVLANMKE